MGEIIKYEPTIGEAFEAIQSEPETPLDALSRQEMAFLLGYVRNGDAAGAALAAGYTPHMSLLASTLLDKPHIRKALRAIRATQRETLRQRQINSAAYALDVVQDIVSNPSVAYETKLKAAMKMIDISGSVAPREMGEELRDDAALERVSADKISLAFDEATKVDDLKALGNK